MIVARRGEVWLVDLGMAAKVRPAVVVSVPASDTDRALVTIVPHTTSPRQSRFEATVPGPFLKTGVFDAQNLVAILTLNWFDILAHWERRNSESSSERSVCGWVCRVRTSVGSIQRHERPRFAAERLQPSGLVSE
jgi:mRNA-degrading endonuclease toxin of MazEF toxin-antitoxin module